MLDQRDDRPATLLAQQEVEQHQIASSFQPGAAADPSADAMYHQAVVQGEGSERRGDAEAPVASETTGSASSGNGLSSVAAAAPKTASALRVVPAEKHRSIVHGICVRAYTRTRTRTRTHARAHQPRFLREGITTRRRHQQLTYATWPHGMVIPVTTSRKLSMFVIHDARARDRALTHASPVVVRRVTPTCKMVSCESRSTMPLKPAPHPRS